MLRKAQDACATAWASRCTTTSLLLAASVAGFTLSAYGAWVGSHLSSSARDYSPLCDSVPGVRGACSAALASPYSHTLSLLGVVPAGHPLDRSNAEFGVVAFAAIAAATLWWPPLSPARTGVLAVWSLAATFASLWLAWVLARVLHVACPVCLATYGCVAVIDYCTLREVSASKLYRYGNEAFVAGVGTGPSAVAAATAGAGEVVGSPRRGKKDE